MWIGTESSIVRFNVQSYRRLDTLRRYADQSLHCAERLLSVDNDVWCVCGDGVIAVFNVHGEVISFHFLFSFFLPFVSKK